MIFIEDDGITYAYKEGAYGLTRMALTNSSDKGFTLTVDERIVPGGQDIELPEITDFAVKVYASEKPQSVLIGSNETDFSYDDKERTLCFTITKEERMASKVVCEVKF